MSDAGIELSGPFFERDPGLTLRGNIEKMMASLASEGEAAARRGFSEGEAGRAVISALGDRVADHVVGRVMARPSRGGRAWRASAVVQVYNEGLDAAASRSLMAAASVLEHRLHVIRGLSRTLRSARAVLTADLTAGLE